MFSPVVSVTSIGISVPTGKDVTFISDVHLGFGTKETDAIREAKLVSLLSDAIDTTCHLFIVGDLFDFWFDYRTSIPKGHIKTLAMLLEFKKRAIPITYLMGNHDFGHWRYFKDELGIEVLGGDVDANIDGKRFYISHGDGKAKNDFGYLVLRSVLRNRAAQALYRWIHPDIGIWLASGTSHGSREYTGAKDFGATDGLREFAHSKIIEGFDVVVMGHRHKSNFENIDSGLYVNLGDWLGDIPTYGKYTSQSGMQLLVVQ